MNWTLRIPVVVSVYKFMCELINCDINHSCDHILSVQLFLHLGQKNVKASIDLGMPHILTMLAHPYVSYPAVGENDFADVMDEVMKVEGKWRALGLALRRLKSSELDCIKSKKSWRSYAAKI